MRFHDLTLLVGVLAASPLAQAQSTTPPGARGLWESTGRDAVHIAVGEQTLTVYDWMGDDVNLLANCYTVTAYDHVTETSPGIFLFRGASPSDILITRLALDNGRLRTGDLGLGEALDLVFDRAAGTEGDLQPRCGPADLSRPGLGESGAQPAGIPLSLPPGISLDGPIQVANLDGSCPGGRPTMPVAGAGMICYCIPLRNDTDSTVTVTFTEFPEGLVLTSASEGYQNGLLLERVILEVPPTEPGPGGFGPPDAVVCGTCANRERHVPDVGVLYGDPKVSPDRAARRLAEMVAGGVLNQEGGAILQEALWDLTEGNGLRASSRDALLAAVQPDTDGDGASDRDEGTGDADGDGVRDDHDPDVTRHVVSIGETDAFVLPPRLGVFVFPEPETLALPTQAATLTLTRLPVAAVGAGGSALPWAYQLALSGYPLSNAQVCLSLYDRDPSATPSALRLFVQEAAGDPWTEVETDLSPSADDPDLICARSLSRLGTFVVAGPGGVASEGGPSASPGLSLTAGPNPAGVRLNVGLALGSDEAAVTVALFDALGRRVAVVHEGPLTAGEHGLTVDTSTLSPGTYLVRASTGTTVVTRPVTVVR